MNSSAYESYVFCVLLLKESSSDETFLERIKQLEADKRRLESELRRQKEETDEVGRFFSEKNDQVNDLQYTY